MDKLPWMQFCTGDWLKDPQLSMCLPATRGIWADAIAAMHENGRCGTLSGTPDQLVRVLRCDVPALLAAVDDLQSTGAADVTHRNGQITLTNRRMQREAKSRELNRLRQLRYRSDQKNNAPVTPMSQPSGSDSLSVSVSKREKGSGEKGELEARFERFWTAYPRREATQNAWKAFQRLNPDDELLSVMIPWIGRACKSEQWQDKSKIPHPATWLNQRRWEGDPPPLLKQQPGKGDPSEKERPRAGIGGESNPANPRKSYAGSPHYTVTGAVK